MPIGKHGDQNEKGDVLQDKGRRTDQDFLYFSERVVEESEIVLLSDFVAIKERKGNASASH